MRSHTRPTNTGSCGPARSLAVGVRSVSPGPHARRRYRSLSARHAHVVTWESGFITVRRLSAMTNPAAS